MASSNLALRMSEIEAKLEQLAQKVESREKEAALPWWEQRWGVFDNSPDYDKAMGLGRKYRESLRLKPAKNGAKKKAVKAKKADMYILDTDLFSLMDRSASLESHRLRFRLSGIRPDDVATIIITFEEQTRGWLAWIAKAHTLEQEIVRYRDLKQMITSYRNVRILDFDEIAASHFVMLRKEYRRLGTMDLKIAAIAMANNATLLSRNLKDFGKIPTLQVEDWAA